MFFYCPQWTSLELAFANTSALTREKNRIIVISFRSSSNEWGLSEANKSRARNKKSGKSGWKIPGLIHLVGHKGNFAVKWSMSNIFWFRLLLNSGKRFFVKFYLVWLNINHSSEKKVKLGSPFIPARHRHSTLTALFTDANEWVKQHRKFAFIRMLRGFSAPVCSRAFLCSFNVRRKQSKTKKVTRTQTFSPQKIGLVLEKWNPFMLLCIALFES